MRKLIFCLSVLFVSASFCAPSQRSESPLYPKIEPYNTGYLQVSDLHSIYWEECGKPEGMPAIVLHGGPGGSAGPHMRRYFDPERFRIVLFDQRGAGRSRPAGEWRENTTQDLIADINRLREHLGVEGKAILLGGSWGSTLAVAYAEAHPDLVAGMVLRGVFLASKAEIDYFYHGGAALFFPDNWQQLRAIVPNPDSMDYPRQLFDMTQSEDPAVRKRAIEGWAFYEIRMVAVNMNEQYAREIVEEYSAEMMPFSVLENYYMAHGCFVDDDQLLREAGRIADIPTFIINGRYDAVCPPKTAFALADKLNDCVLEFADGAGHSEREPPVTEAIVRGVKLVADKVEAGEK